MTANPGAISCRWAGLTLFQPYPVWLASEETPWSCLRTIPARPLASTDACRTCPDWEPQVEGTNDGKTR